MFQFLINLLIYLSLNSGTVSQQVTDFISVIPDLNGSVKGDSGKICVIGGSTEYSGAPYFSAISALKTGADLVYVITTESASPVIKAYSPDLIVYPYLKHDNLPDIYKLLEKMDTIVIGPGLGREEGTIELFHNIVSKCNELQKPIIIDADGLYAVSKNIDVIKDYRGGAILTPNHKEAKRLLKAIGPNEGGYRYWGSNVTLLVKGEVDTFLATNKSLECSVVGGGSGRRAAGQGDILSGVLGTIYNWYLKSNLYNKFPTKDHAAAGAAVEASRITRSCNEKAFNIYGRSMIASDMINQIHVTLAELSGY